MRGKRKKARHARKKTCLQEQFMKKEEDISAGLSAWKDFKC